LIVSKRPSPHKILTKSKEQSIFEFTSQTNTITNMSKDPELLKKLIDDDELQNVELQKEESPLLVTGVYVKPYSAKKRGGCPCWCKCIGFTALTFILAIFLAMMFAYSAFKGLVEDLTIETDSPQKFPIVEMSDSELNMVADRVSSFFDGILDGKSEIEDLVLEQDEINGFIGHSDYLRGNLMVSFHKNLIVEEFSLPMDVLGLDDRYFVGNDYLAIKSGQLLEAKMETEALHKDWFDGPLFFMQLHYLISKNKEDEGKTMLELYLEKGSFFGQVIPQEYIDERDNVMEYLYDADDDDVETFLTIVDGIERVSIEEGKVSFKARPRSNSYYLN